MTNKEIQSLYKSQLGAGASYKRTRAPEAEPFWAGCEDGELRLPWCLACHEPHFYPRSFCPHCGHQELEWRRMSGHGEIYSFAVVEAPIEKAFAEMLPYVVVIVELKEGVRLLSHLVEANVNKVHCGQSVEVQFFKMPGGITAPVFIAAPGRK
tara:strand:+ start:24456 stop:24914 length:459 start_codon:yes stop_codon:yes gene_type:complete